MGTGTGRTARLWRSARSHAQAGDRSAAARAGARRSGRYLDLVSGRDQSGRCPGATRLVIVIHEHPRGVVRRCPVQIADERPVDRGATFGRIVFACTDDARVEGGIPPPLGDRRRDMDALVSQCNAHRRPVADPDAMTPGNGDPAHHDGNAVTASAGRTDRRENGPGKGCRHRARTEEFADIVLTMPDMNAPVRIAGPCRRAPHIPQPADAFLRFGRHAGRIDVSLQRRPLEPGA